MLRLLRYSIKMYFYFSNANNLTRFKKKPTYFLNFTQKKAKKKSRIF